jgi:hemerythrin-like metal-binding protein
MNSNYIIGVAEMDDQHSQIFEIAARAKQPDLDEMDIQIIMTELVNYAKEHLESEEKLLADQGLHDFLKEHVKLHQRFREQAMSMYQELRKAEELENKRAILLQTAEFCESWLKTHIDVEDRKYVELLKKK